MDTSGLREFVRRREAVRLKRESGAPPPWTDDPVLRDYRFCNVSRWLDSTTVRLLRAVEVAHIGVGPLWALALCVGLRCSSYLPLAQLCCDEPPRDPKELEERVLRVTLERGRAVTPSFTRAGPGSRLVVDPAAAVLANGPGFLASIQAENRVEHAATALRLLPWVGPFLAYLAAVDLTATPILPAPRDPHWTDPGPGARRGLARCGATEDAAGVAAIAAEFAADQPVASWRMDAHDVEHSLCEYHKWARATEGGRRPRERRNDG